jgi:hypothetical protein
MKEGSDQQWMEELTRIGATHRTHRGTHQTLFGTPIRHSAGVRDEVASRSRVSNDEGRNVSETVCSLRFASQVNQCELGKPKKTTTTKVSKGEGGATAG